MRLASTFIFIAMLLVTSVASAQVPLGSAISIKGTGGGGGSSASDPTVFDVTDYGAIADDGLTDVAAFQAAADAACALTGDKVIEIPAGDFHMGDDTETSFYNGSAVVIDSGCDNLTIKGAGRTATRLLAESTNGQTMIAVCNFNISDCNDADTTVTKNFKLSDLALVDLDPALHGGQNSGYAFAPAATGGTPAFGDPVSWSGGSGTIHGYDSGRGLYIIADPTNTPTGTLTTSAGWTAGVITSGAGTRTEGTHGLATKYVDGLTVERVDCLDISDECLDFKIDSNNVLVQDFRSTGVGQVNEGGSAIGIDCTTSATVDNFYIDGGTSSTSSASGGAIVVATNCVAAGDDDPIAENVRILNGTMIDTSVDVEDKIETGLTFSLNTSVSNPDANDPILRNVVVQNVNISGFQDAIAAGGTTGDGDVTFINVIADGGYEDVATYRNRLITTRFDNNDNTVTIRGIEYMSGSYVSSTSGTDALTISHAFTMVGSEIEHLGGVGDDCLLLNSGPNMVTGSIFRTCGVGSSAGHRPVDSGSSSSDTVLIGNLKAGGHATSAFGTGAASPGTGCSGGLTSGIALCDLNLISP